MIRRHVVGDDGAHVKATVWFSAGTRVSKAVGRSSETRHYKPDMGDRNRIEMICAIQGEREGKARDNREIIEGLAYTFDYRKG